MKIKSFIKENYFFNLIFFSYILLFNLVLYIDREIKLEINDIIYINFLFLFIFFCIELVRFFKVNKRRQYIDELKFCNENFSEIEFPQNYYEDKINKIIEISRIQDRKLRLELSEKHIELTEFISKWTHEIKIPISVLNLLVENKVIDKSKLKYELERIEQYIEQILYASRFSDYKENVAITEVKLDAIIKDVIKKNRTQFILKRVKISFKNIELEVVTDKKWIYYIINQIVNNSLKYVEQGGEIIITGEILKDKKILSIIDNGIGISEDEINRIFDKGYTGQKSMSKSTGMGLYYSINIANELNHKLKVESKENRYTKVSVEFLNFSDLYHF